MAVGVDDMIRLGMGTLTFWGCTPALNLTNIVTRDGDEANIMLIGQSDMRHVLKTLAESHGFLNIGIFLVESHPVLYARQLLLLYMALRPKEQLGLHEKTSQLMEIYGNLLIRPQTKKSVKNYARDLIAILSNDQTRKEKMGFLELGDMRHRELDMIVEILKFWVDTDLSADEMKNLWDIRVRQGLGTRYDSRMGIFDWDYQMRVIDKNPSTRIIHVTEYKRWRDTGLAFHDFEKDYSQANVTLLTGCRQSFRGDILVGPFLAHGINSSNDAFFDKVNFDYKHKSQELTFDNLQSVLGALEDLDLCNPNGNQDNNGLQFKLHLLPIDSSIGLHKKSKFQGVFDAIYVSNFMGHNLKKTLTCLLKKDGAVYVETSKYVWYFRQENDNAYIEKTNELAGQADLLKCGSYESNVLTKYIKSSVENENNTPSEQDSKSH